jgi:ribosome-interacting GTPase 1
MKRVGRQVIKVAKTCHLISIVLDVNGLLTDKKIIEAELEVWDSTTFTSPENPECTMRGKYIFRDSRSSLHCL